MRTELSASHAPPSRRNCSSAPLRYSVLVTPEELAEAIHTVLTTAVDDGSLALPVEEVPLPRVERPRNRDHGDWATNVAMQLAKKAGTNPRALAELLVPRLAELDGVDSVEIAGPGFLNFRLSAASAGELARTIVEAGEAYGRNDALAGQHVNLEYVSANPTGPVHLGGARWAAVGDSLARILVACGATVTREYYFNDHGTQIDRFASSLLASARGQEIPEDGYGGAYITEIAQKVIADELAAGRPDPIGLPDDEATEVFRAHGVDLMFDAIKSELHAFRSDFDVFFHEESLHSSGAVARSIDILRERGVIEDRDGATWLRTTEFGDDKDRVLIKSDGNAAYFAADLAYYLDKRERGADCCIFLFGADHHGYIARMKAALHLLGYDENRLEIILSQMVSLLKDGEAYKMSKRAGNVVLMSDVVEEIGYEALRFMFLSKRCDTHLEFDVDELKREDSSNPIFYINYAHARINQIFAKAGKNVADVAGVKFANLNEDGKNLLFEALALNDVLVDSFNTRAVNKICDYLKSLAANFHKFYNENRVVGSENEDELLKLFAVVALSIKTALGLMGIAAKDKM